MDRRRLIALVIFFFMVLGVGFLLYRIFFATKTTRPPTTTGPKTTTTTPVVFPGSGTGGTRGTVGGGTGTTGGQTPGQQGGQTGPTTAPRSTRIADVRVHSAHLDASGHLRFYNKQDGKVYTLDASGTLKPLSDQVFFSAQQITWSPKQESAIIEYPDGSNVYYDFATKKQTTLPKHWESFSFSPDGGKIEALSMTLAPENRWLVTSDTNGQNVTLVEPLGNNADKVTVDWSPNKQVLAFSKTGQPLGDDRQEILLVGQYGENFKSLTVEGRGFNSTWSKTGEKLVYNVYSTRTSYKPELWVVGASGDRIGSGRKVLGVATWANKCTFQDDRFVYCGVPDTLPDGAGFAPQIANTTNDTIYRIDTSTGTKTPINIGRTITVNSIQVSTDGKTLYVTDQQSEGLYQVAL